MAAVDHKFVGAEPHPARFFIQGPGGGDGLAPVRGRMNVDLDDAWIGRDLQVVWMGWRWWFPFVRFCPVSRSNPMAEVWRWQFFVGPLEIRGWVPIGPRALVSAAAIRSAENEAREQAAAVADGWAAHYPVDVFPPEGASLDAKAAGHGRHVAKCIAADIRKASEATR
jgi:hypothetical protein